MAIRQDYTPISMIWSYCRPNVYKPVDGEIFQQPCPKCTHTHGVIVRRKIRIQNGRHNSPTTHHQFAISCRACGFSCDPAWSWNRLQDNWIFPNGKPDERPVPSWMVGKQYSGRAAGKPLHLQKFSQ